MFGISVHLPRIMQKQVFSLMQWLKVIADDGGRSLLEETAP